MLNRLSWNRTHNNIKKGEKCDKRLSFFHLEDQLILWILDFLTHRSQRALVNNNYSDL